MLPVKLNQEALLLLPCMYSVFRSPGNIYLFKVNNVNTRTICKVGSKLTIKTRG